MTELKHKEYDVLGVLTDVSKQDSVENLAQRAIADVRQDPHRLQ